MKSKAGKGAKRRRRSQTESVSEWQLRIVLLTAKPSSCLPFPSWGRCRCLCTAETSPARPWPEPAWCASPPPQWEPGTPQGNRTPPARQTPSSLQQTTSYTSVQRNRNNSNCEKKMRSAAGETNTRWIWSFKRFQKLQPEWVHQQNNETKHAERRWRWKQHPPHIHDDSNDMKMQVKATDPLHWWCAAFSLLRLFHFSIKQFCAQAAQCVGLV